MSELKFTREDNKKYNTISINIENALTEIKENDYNILNTENTKFGYRKVNLRINNKDLKEKLKSWETEINEYLKNEVGTGLLCIYPVLPSSVHVCIYFDWFPLWLFLELDFLLWNIVLDVSGPFYSLITRNYATDFNMNFLDVSLLL